MFIMGKPTRWKRLLSTTLTKAWWHRTAFLILCVVFQHSSLRKHHHLWASCPRGKGRHPTSISCCIPKRMWKKTAQGGEDLSERGLPPSCFQIRTPLKSEGCHLCCRYKCWKVSSFSSTSYALPGAAPGSDLSLVASRAVWGNTTICCHYYPLPLPPVPGCSQRAPTHSQNSGPMLHV